MMIRYKIRSEYLEEHLDLLGAVYRELHARRPDGLRWATFREDDGVSFVDVASGAGGGRLSSLTTWAAYRGTLDARCEEPPALTELHEVEAYRPAE
jgi:hypothetical protein